MPTLSWQVHAEKSQAMEAQAHSIQAEWDDPPIANGSNGNGSADPGHGGHGGHDHQRHGTPSHGELLGAVGPQGLSCGRSWPGVSPDSRDVLRFSFWGRWILGQIAL